MIILFSSFLFGSATTGSRLQAAPPEGLLEAQNERPHEWLIFVLKEQA